MVDENIGSSGRLLKQPDPTIDSPLWIVKCKARAASPYTFSPHLPPSPLLAVLLCPVRTRS